MSNWQEKETAARRTIEDHGFAVHDANVLFRANCPNIDLVVFGKTKAAYIQVKSSETPALREGVVIDGSPWTEAQLKDAPIFNKHGDPGQYQAALVLIVDRPKSGGMNFYIAPPKELEDLLKTRGRAWAKHPKKNGTTRSIGFRKELSREELKDWREAWHLLNSLLD
jgi:hypothetical protein